MQETEFLIKNVTARFKFGITVPSLFVQRNTQWLYYAFCLEQLFVFIVSWNRRSTQNVSSKTNCKMKVQYLWRISTWRQASLNTNELLYLLSHKFIAKWNYKCSLTKNFFAFLTKNSPNVSNNAKASASFLYRKMYRLANGISRLLILLNQSAS